MIKRRLWFFISVFGILITGSVAVAVHLEEKKLAYTLYPVDEGWGYDINIEGKTIIHQPFIPAMEGNRPFPDRRTAKETACLVLEKLECGESPALSREEIGLILNKRGQ